MASLALVTGAARGIGAVTVDRLRADGFEVVGLDREPGCELQYDLLSPDPPPSVLAEVEVLVSNAGVTNTIAPAHSMTLEQWRRDIDVNLTGAFRVVQAALVGMRERRSGRIVLVSSLAARLGLPGQVAYAASKAGLLGMARAVAGENAARGITCNVVLPGVVGTEMVRAMPEAVLANVTRMQPAGRLVEPEEVAAVIAFLCSPAAGSVTGEEIAVGGGLGLNTTPITAKPRD